MYGVHDVNNKRRSSIALAISLITKASAIIESALDEEQDCIDNYPESLQGTDRYDKMEDAASYLESASERIDDVIDSLQSAIQ